jgi:hypothetical protein
MYVCTHTDTHEPTHILKCCAGSIGDMLFFHSYKKDGMTLDLIGDIRELNMKAMKAKHTGAIIIGGGVVKHHIMNANLMRNGEFSQDYADKYAGCTCRWQNRAYICVCVCVGICTYTIVENPEVHRQLPDIADDKFIYDACTHFSADNSVCIHVGADECVLINTAQEFDGSDGGARLDEAVSWGKIRYGARPVKVSINIYIYIHTYTLYVCVCVCHTEVALDKSTLNLANHVCVCFFKVEAVDYSAICAFAHAHLMNVWMLSKYLIAVSALFFADLRGRHHCVPSSGCTDICQGLPRRQS